MPTEWTLIGLAVLGTLALLSWSLSNSSRARLPQRSLASRTARPRAAKRKVD